MPDTAEAAAVLLAAAAQEGLGNPLRIVLLASLVGGALFAWFLLRGYRGAGDTADDVNADANADDDANA